MVFIWLLIALIFVLLEMGSPGLFYFLSFTLGSLAAAGVSPLFSLDAQISIFLAVSLISFFLLSRLFRRSLTLEVVPTNVDALIGKKALVTKDIFPARAGKVKIDGVEWVAKSDQKIGIDSSIEVIKISGCHVIVKQVELH